MNRILIVITGFLVLAVIIKLFWGDPQAMILQIAILIAAFFVGRAYRKWSERS